MYGRQVQVSLTKLAAATCGLLGLSIVVADMFWFTHSDDIGHLGLVFSCGAAVLQVRAYFCEFYRRQEVAFQLGRDDGARVRSLR